MTDMIHNWRKYTHDTYFQICLKDSRNPLSVKEKEIPKFHKRNVWLAWRGAGILIIYFFL